MKKTFYKIFALLGVTSLVFLADACLKDDRFVDFSKVGAIVEFPDAVAGKAIALSFAALVDTPDTVWVRVNQTGPTATDHDLELGIGTSTAALDAYNQDTTHVVGVMLPSDAFVLPASVTIKAGKDSANNNNRAAQFPVLLYSKKASVQGINYVLPISIASAPAGFTISGNYGAILFNFYHNNYDGDYKSTGTRYNFNQASDYTGWDPVLDKPLATSVIASTSPWNFAHAPVVTVNATVSTVHAGNDLAAFGTLNFKVNPTTNAVTVIATPETLLNALVPLAGSGAPSSTYDPATKTVKLYYQYTNTTGTFRVLKDKLVHY